ncbi:MAG: GspE/PulE family protein [Bacilli bacterium]|nr:GspE/PulE family protein [Bacilli bacterium]
MLKTFDFEKMPIVEIVNDILVDSAKRGASDIHFDPQTEFMKIRIRIDGALEDYAEIPNAVKKNLTTRIKIISGMNITESRLPQDGAIKATLKDMDLDLRVSVLPISGGEKIVIRILDYTRSLAGLEQLDFSEENFKKVLHMINVPNGIVLITGATGSGKSTTVYSILQRLNKEETNIITVEDPVEMDVEGINQVQTNSEIGLTFAAALRSILRQDPNIIMIGEIRDTETAKIAVRASITGHLVLSTLHTNTALNTIERLLDMEVERYLLSSALTGIISQKLARRLCPKCKKLRATNDYEKTLFKNVLGHDVNQVYAAEGCEECGNGYKGRIAIHEVLLINEEIRDALSNGISKEELRDLVYNTGAITMLQDGLQKVEDGHSTVEEILKLIELDDDNLNKKSKDSELRAQLEASKKTKDNDSVKEELSGKDLKIEMPVKKQVEEEPVSDTLTLNDKSEESLSIEEPESLSIEEPESLSEEPESLSFGEEIEKLEF